MFTFFVSELYSNFMQVYVQGKHMPVNFRAFHLGVSQVLKWCLDFCFLVEV